MSNGCKEVRAKVFALLFNLLDPGDVRAYYNQLTCIVDKRSLHLDVLSLKLLLRRLI